MTHLQIDIQYGEYTIALSTLEDRSLCNIYMTDGRGQVLTNRLVAPSTAPRKDLDFYLAGVEIFAKEAIAKVLRDAGATNPT